MGKKLRNKKQYPTRGTTTFKSGKSKRERWLLMIKEAEEYFAIHNSDRHPLIKKYHKSKHFLKWAIKLLVPDFLIGHPNLWDNIKTLRNHPQFKPLRMAIMAWTIFVCTFISISIYFLQYATKIMALSPVSDTFTDTTKIATSTNIKIDTETGQIKLSAWTCGEKFTDLRDNKEYSTVLIGSQCWMAENMNIGTMTAGTNNQGNDCPSATEIEKYCYNDIEENCTTDGGLYQWPQAMCATSGCNGIDESQPACAAPVQGICPAGWHIPSHYEFTALERAVCTSATCATDFPYDTSTTIVYRGTNEGTNLKTGGSSGFNAILAGFRYTNKLFQDRGTLAFFWTSMDNGANAWNHAVRSNHTKAYRGNNTSKYAGLSIRCIQNGAVVAGGGAMTYRKNGSIVSANILSGKPSSSIDNFTYNLSSKPAGTEATIKFSLDNTNWYNSSGVLDGADILTTGINNTIDLSALDWAGENFYYKTTFTSDGANTPVLDDVNLGFSNLPPKAPANIAPTDRAAEQNLNPTLTGSPYSDKENNPHITTDWQVDNDPDFTTPAWTRTTNTAETSTIINNNNGTFANELADKTGLAHNTTYYWRVRYSDGAWSPYSNSSTFTTYSIPTPINSSPATRPKIEVRPVFGNTTVDQGDTVNIDVQIIDSTTGLPLNNAPVKIDVYNPSGAKTVNEASMTHIPDSKGIYRYSYTIPATSGSYLYEVAASLDGESGYGAANFEVRTIASDINSAKSAAEADLAAREDSRAKIEDIEAKTADIQAKITEHETAQAAERAAQTAERMIQSTFRVDTSSQLDDIEDKMDSIIINLNTIDSNLQSALSTINVIRSSRQNNNEQIIGAPAQVMINFMSDISIPSISANTTIINEGNKTFEYRYEWCVVSSLNNECGGNDDTYYASAAKLIAAGGSFNPTLTATVPNTGNYLFKVSVHYDTGTSTASRTFTAATDGYETSPLVPDSSTIQDIYSEITKTSQKLAETLEILDLSGPDVQNLLSISASNTENLTDIQSEIADLQAVSSTIRHIIEQKTEQKTATPIVEKYMRFNSVEINFLVSNPDTVRQTVKFKEFLPKEIKTEHILNDSGLNIGYDSGEKTYYVSGEISLEPKETVTRKVEMKDIWVFTPEEIKEIKKQTDSLSSRLAKTQYEAQAAILKSGINSTLNIVSLRQEESYSSPENHIIAYRENKERFAEAQNNLEKLKELAEKADTSPTPIMRIENIRTITLWGIILAIILGLGLASKTIFAMWRHQTITTAAAMGMGRKAIAAHFGINPTAGYFRAPARISMTPATTHNTAHMANTWHLPENGWISIAIIGASAILITLIIKYVPNLFSKTLSDMPKTAETNSIEPFPSAKTQEHATTITKPVNPKLKITNTPTGWLKVRDAASLKGKELTKVHPGEEYEYTNKQNNWYQIILTDKSTGWVYGQYIKTKEPIY